MSSEAKTIEIGGETYEYDAEKPWRDADLLEELYWTKGMSQRDVGGVLGCSNDTVSRWMDRLDIDSHKTKSKRVPYFGHHQNGYEVWRHKVSDTKYNVKIHRLLAVAEYGFDTVCGNHVHHQNHIPWDNRPQNIEVKSPENHQRDHSDKRHGHKQTPWRNKERLRKLYVDQLMSQQEIADRWGCHQRTISYWLDKYGIETRSCGRPAKEEVEQNQQTLTEAE